MGGEWASGAALVARDVADAAARPRARLHAERVGDRVRGRGVVVGFVLPRWGWRAVFFVGVLPALFTLWVRRNVEEPATWRVDTRRAHGRGPRFADMFRAPIGRLTAAVTSDERVHAVRLVGAQQLGARLLFAARPRRAASASARRRCRGSSSPMQLGMWLGYVTFGYIAGRVGRKRVYIASTSSRRACCCRSTAC